MSNAPEILPRPCSPWQAIDTGIQLARKEFFTLLRLWLVVALPVLALCALLGWLMADQGALAGLIFWWMKPAAELPLVMYLSRVVFGERPDFHQTLQMARANIGRLLATYLSLSRLSFTRGMTAPVVYLEHLRGQRRRQRVALLLGTGGRAAILQGFMIHVEMVLYYALGMLLLALMPGNSQGMMVSILDNLIATTSVTWIIVNLLGVFVSAMLVAPFFVAAGFMLYINRRMHLEAWDLAQHFRTIAEANVDETRLRKPTIPGRSGSVLAVALLLAISFVGLPAETAMASEFNALGPTVTYADEKATRANVSDRITLGEAGVQKTLESLFAEPEFSSTRTVTRPRAKKEKEPSEKAASGKWRALSLFLLKGFDVITALIPWLAMILGGWLLFVVVRKLKDGQWQRRPVARRARSTVVLRGEYTRADEKLPHDIVAAVRESLSLGQNRRALSLLYRGSLRLFESRYGQPLMASLTEHEYLSIGRRQYHPAEQALLAKLVDSWQNSAWAGHQVSVADINKLLEEYESINRGNFRTGEAP